MARTGKGGSKKIPALEYFEVRFVEIEALLDLSGDALVAADGAGVPRVLHSWPGLAGRTEYLDGMGREVYAPQRLSNPTLFVEERGGRQLRRTFARDRSQPIDGKWVYVFRAEEPDGREAKLVAELSFRRGRFRRVGARDRRADPRKGQASEAEALLLERAAVNAPARPYGYFFHLGFDRLRPVHVGITAGRRAEAAP